ncbi:hypothetical protein SAMN05421643_11556 [Acinetobacter kyonggiensis]|uniref:Uncharacterized protein n=1 Tax=Acinetobacter kyonggiensis TaxID=595670 RepID=A0A1H3L248_9GAMM|nr:hypothetical protein SAMN05421643_11556 [Acinetobacter kyonggiensis]
MTKSIFSLQTGIIFVIIMLQIFAIFLWLKTPLLFESFNQAFCAH